MHLIAIKIKNSKIIKLARIKFEKGKMVILRAKNAEGKSTILQTILQIFRAYKIKNPVNKDATSQKTETEVIVGVDGVEYYKIKETRNTKGQSLKLSVISLNDAPEISSKCRTSWLSGLVSPLIADVLEFFNYSRDKQTQILKDMQGLDFTELDSQQAKYSEERRLESQNTKLLEKQLNVIVDDFVGVPDTPINISDIKNKISDLKDEKRKYFHYHENLLKKKEEKSEILEKLKILNVSIKQLEENSIENPDVEVIEKLESEYDNASDINIRVSKKADAKKLSREVEESKATREICN